MPLTSRVPVVVAGLTKSGALNSCALRILPLMGEYSWCVCVGVCAEPQSVWGIYIDLERCLGAVQSWSFSRPIWYCHMWVFLPTSKAREDDFHTVFCTSTRFNWGCETKAQRWVAYSISFAPHTPHRCQQPQSLASLLKKFLSITSEIVRS